jgi:hypothetical protein
MKRTTFLSLLIGRPVGAERRTKVLHRSRPVERVLAQEATTADVFGAAALARTASRIVRRSSVFASSPREIAIS